MPLSQRSHMLPVSSVRTLIPRANTAKKQGVKIYHLNMGQPDVKSPKVMIDALKNWKSDLVAYAPSGGTPEFIEALQQYYHNLGHSFVSEECILSTIGGSEAVAMCMFAVCEPGDDILVFEPFYSGYATSAHIAGVNLVPVPTDIQKGFHLPSKDEIYNYITPKTKAILYSNPCNPTGTVYTPKEIEMLVKIARERDLFLLSDEVYREYCFVDYPHTSILSFMEDLPEKTILIDSLSKRYNLCGGRLGVLVSLNKEFLSVSLKYAMSRLSGGVIDQFIGAQLTNVPQKYIEDVQKEYKKRRDILYEGLQQIDGITVSQPEGAFYVMAGLPVNDAEAFCIWLLEEFRDNNETVMMAPGNGFYATPEMGKNEVRIAYILEEKALQRSLELLEKGLKEYKLVTSH